MTPPVVDLPTEILCTIFEVSSAQYALSTAPASTGSIRGPETRALRLPAHPTRSEFCALPSLRERTLHSIALSHVCARWRRIAVALQVLWGALYLGGCMFDNHMREMTEDFLARSGLGPLFLDIVVGAAPDTEFQPGIIRKVLRDHVQRCHSLRVLASDLVITDVFDAFVDYNLSNITPFHIRASPLTRIHVIQTSTTRSKPTFPSDLNIVSPNLVSLRVQSAPISSYPRWHLQDVFLDGTHLSYHNHFHLFMKAATKRLVLHRVIIPGGAPYVRRLINSQDSPVISLVLSELRCIGPQEEHQNLYTMFFALTLYQNLQELELVNLDRPALLGLVESLRPPLPLVFSELRKLTLRGIDITTREAVLTMAISFPALNEMVLENTLAASSILVFDTWMMAGFQQAVWPQLEEMVVNGEVIRRR